MNLSPLLALLAPFALAAQNSPAIALEKIAEIPAVVNTGSWQTAFSPDFSLIAAAGETSVGVWRVVDGHQIARIPVPRVSKTDKNDWIGFTVGDIAPDGRSLLLQLEHHRDWKQGEYAVYLVSLADEKVRPLLLERKYCQHQLEVDSGFNMTFCPGASSSFSPDGRRVLITDDAVTEYPVHRAAPFFHEYEAVALDLDGKVQQRIKEVFRQDPYQQTEKLWPPQVAQTPTGARVSGFRRDGTLVGVLQDESSCELRDLGADKRIAFLDDCNRGDALQFDRSRALASSTDKVVKRWDLSTGKLIAKLPCANCDIRFTENNDYAFVAHRDSPFRLEIRERPFETALFSTNTIGTDAVYYWGISPDGGLLVQKIGEGRSAVYKTGLASKPAQTALAEATLDVDSPPATKTAADPNAYAVVIGVEKYRQDGIPSVDFAAHDAQTMAAYLTGAMGFDAKNVVLLTDSQATRTDLEKNLKWLSNRVSEKSRVFFYYAGHGSPNPETGQGYLMPYEADPSYLDETAFPISKLYASLGKLPTKDVTVVLDACFSGQGGRSLIAKGTRPLVSVVQSKAEPNTVVLAAAGSNQVSASFPEARHGLLTYFLLAGLQGEADAKHDGRITADELIAYVRPAVERAAKLQNVEQTPSLMSPSGAVSRPWIVLTPKK